MILRLTPLVLPITLVLAACTSPAPRLRSEAPVSEITATIDSLRAGGTIDLLLQDSVQEFGAKVSSGVAVGM